MLKSDFGQGRPVLTSLKNERIKYVSKLLKDAKLRHAANAFVIEGVRLFSEVKEEDIIDAFYTEEIWNRMDGGLPQEKADATKNKLRSLIEKGKANSVTDEVYKKLSDTDNPQGIAAVVRIKAHEISEIKHGQNTFILIIESLRDPGNLGTIIRTAEGAGVTGILLSSDSVDVYNPKVVRGTMGSILRVPICISADIVGDTKRLKESGVTVFGTHLSGNNMYSENFSGPVAFMIGNEGAGLSDALSENADRLIKIPMEGEVESLNASISAGIVCYEVLRQRIYQGDSSSGKLHFAQPDLPEGASPWEMV